MPVTSEEIITPNWHKETTGDHDHVLLSSIPKDGGWKITKFETTPPMSSYIVAYANGHFKYLEDSVVLPLSGKELPLRIYSGATFLISPPSRLLKIPYSLATAEHIHQARFALDVKKAVLPLYEKVFDIGYPLPKLDTLVVRLNIRYQLVG